MHSFSCINNSVNCVPVIDDVALLITYSVIALQDANCTYMPAFRIWCEHKWYINSAGWTVTVLCIKPRVFHIDYKWSMKCMYGSKWHCSLDVMSFAVTVFTDWHWVTYRCLWSVVKTNRRHCFAAVFQEQIEWMAV